MCVMRSRENAFPIFQYLSGVNILDEAEDFHLLFILRIILSALSNTQKTRTLVRPAN